jgi:outer membrane protein OmpA-like peptidoglycan-associated protein
MNNLQFFLLLASQMILCQNMQAQFRVQVAAFVETVPGDYFRKAGLDGVSVFTDQNQIHRYYIGDYITRDLAEAKRAEVIGRGFSNAQIIDIEEQRALCTAPCPYVRGGASTYVSEETDQLYLKSIFFDYDRSSLRPESVDHLNNLSQVLTAHPDYRVQLLAHTDSRGSAEYNISLSKRRARTARNFLVAKGVPLYRVGSKVFGEGEPIAINVFADGRDSPEGRQYNRRVVVVVTDSKGEILADLVAPIIVPDNLRVAR